MSTTDQPTPTVRLTCAPDCYHPGLPHIADLTVGDHLHCHARAPGGVAICTREGRHSGQHAAGDGDHLTAVWDQEPHADWTHWRADHDTAVDYLAVVSFVAGDAANVGWGGMEWEPAERDGTPGARAVSAYESLVEQECTGDQYARVRLVLVPVPPALRDLARVPSESGEVTSWLEARSDDYEVALVPWEETVHTPGDPEPTVTLIVQPQTTTKARVDVAAGPGTRHDVTALLRRTARDEVAGLRVNDDSLDQFVLAHRLRGTHRGGFHARFVDPRGGEDPEVDVPGTADDTPPAIRAWLAWADRNRNLLGTP